MHDLQQAPAAQLGPPYELQTGQQNMQETTDLQLSQSPIYPIEFDGKISKIYFDVTEPHLEPTYFLHLMGEVAG